MLRATAIAALSLVLTVAAAPLAAQEVEPGAGTVPTGDDGGARDVGSPEAGGVSVASRSQPGDGTRPAGAFPPDPRPFQRGNVSPDPGGGVGASVTGGYFSLLRFAAVLGGFFIWIYGSQWTNEDSRLLSLRTEYWNTILYASGLSGLLFLLVMPIFFAGYTVAALAIGVPLGLYIKERNGRVPEASKVMTPNHIRNVTIRTLGRLGIHVGSRELQESAVGPPIVFLGKSDGHRGSDEDARSRQVENSKGFLAAKELIYDAILRRATDVHLEPKDDELAIRIRIDGVMYPTEPFDRGIGDAIVNIFKVLAAMDITERRRPQDGSFRARLEGREIDFRVATQGTRHGEKMSLRILDQSGSVSTLAGLGLRRQLLERLDEVIHEPHGLVLTCGPTGAGKSTTLYAALCALDSFQQNIITVEDPVEYKIENVNQIEINTKAGQTFGKSLRSILRQDPDVVMVGEIRDGETAEVACQAANTGHMVFSTLHANDTITGLYRLLELGVEPFMVANSISAILGQRLARRLCPDCKEAYKPKPEFLKQAGLNPQKIEHFYRPPVDPETPCPKCSGLGYFGRIGVFELLVISDRMRDLIREKAALSAVKAEARKNGMLTMKEEGLRLVVRGITSIEELLRVVK